MVPLFINFAYPCIPPAVHAIVESEFSTDNCGFDPVLTSAGTQSATSCGGGKFRERKCESRATLVDLSERTV